MFGFGKKNKDDVKADVKASTAINTTKTAVKKSNKEFYEETLKAAQASADTAVKEDAAHKTDSLFLAIGKFELAEQYLKMHLDDAKKEEKFAEKKLRCEIRLTLLGLYSALPDNLSGSDASAKPNGISACHTQLSQLKIKELLNEALTFGDPSFVLQALEVIRDATIWPLAEKLTVFEKVYSAHNYNSKLSLKFNQVTCILAAAHRDQKDMPKAIDLLKQKYLKVDPPSAELSQFGFTPLAIKGERDECWADLQTFLREPRLSNGWTGNEIYAAVSACNHKVGKEALAKNCVTYARLKEKFNGTQLPELQKWTGCDQKAGATLGAPSAVESLSTPTAPNPPSAPPEAPSAPTTAPSAPLESPSVPIAPPPPLSLN